MTGVVLWSSVKGQKLIKQVAPSEIIQDEIEGIWHKDKQSISEKLWSGILMVFDNKNEKIKYFYHDPYKERLFDHAEEWKAQYFPGMEFEPDENEDNWWEF